MKPKGLLTYFRPHIAYLRAHWASLTNTLLMSGIFVLSVFPLLLSIGLGDTVVASARKQLVSIGLVLLVGILLARKRIRRLTTRYANTWTLQNRSFLPLECLLWFTVFSSALIFIFKSAIAPNLRSYLLAVAIVLVVYWVVALSPAPRDHKEKSEDYFRWLPDEPINAIEEDSLGRQPFIDGLFKEIINIPFSDSFVFGLYGDWGEGKTSVINLLLQKFNETERLSGAADFLLLNFDPWHFNNKKDIFRAFYHEVERTISNKFIIPDLKRSLRDYARITSPKLEAGINLDFTFAEESLEEVKNRVESYITRTNRKLVVFIDDIDRLDSGEVLAVLKIVRLNARFKNTIFVLSFDYEAICAKLAVGNEKSGKEYLEKIIQKPINLPKIERLHIDEFLFFSDHPIPEYLIRELSGLNKDKMKVSISGVIKEISESELTLVSSEAPSDDTIMIRIRRGAERVKQLNLKVGESVYVEGILQREEILLDYSQLEITRFRLSWIDILLAELYRGRKITYEDIRQFNDDFTHFYRTDVSRLFQNLRDAKRFINSLYSSLPAIADEVNIRDFILLEIIKVHAPELYNDIFENWWFYVEQRAAGDDFTNPLTFRFLNKREEQNATQREHIIEALDKFVTDRAEKAILTEVIEKLFPNVLGGHELLNPKDSRERKKLYSNAFGKYFTLNVPSAELPDTYIESLLESTDEQTIQGLFLQLRDKNQLKELLEKLNRVFLPRIQRDTALVLIDVIYKNASRLSRFGGGFRYFFNSEFDKGEALLINLIFERLNNDDKQQKLDEVVLNTPDLYFAVSLVQDIRRKNEDFGKVLRLGEIHSKLTDRLRTYFVLQNKDIFDEMDDPKEWGFILYMWATNWETDLGNRGVVNAYVISQLNNRASKFVQFIEAYRQKTLRGDLAWNFQYFVRVYELSDFESLGRNVLKDESLTPQQQTVIKDFLDALAEYAGRPLTSTPPHEPESKN